MKSYRPVIVLARDWILQRLSLRVTLNARIVCSDKIQFCRIDDVRPVRIGGVIAPGPMAAFTPDVPLLDVFGCDVVVDGMTTITQRSRRSLRVVGWIESNPPVGVGLH